MNFVLFFTGLLCISRNIDACDIEVQGVEDKDKEIIVNKHNELRAKVANGEQEGLPTASNMLQLEWDDDVAQRAQEWANQCTFEHDPAGQRSEGFDENVGQNLYKNWNTNEDPDWEEAIQVLYDEVSVFDSGTIDSYEFESGSGHFTQVIWAKTYKVGCGYVRYKEGDNYLHLYVLNYFPGGNMKGSSIYQKGKPCSLCGGCGSIQGLCQHTDDDSVETDDEAVDEGEVR